MIHNDDTITTPDQLDALPERFQFSHESYGPDLARDATRVLLAITDSGHAAEPSSMLRFYAITAAQALTPARGSADAETLRAEVERLRADNARLYAEHPTNLRRMFIAADRKSAAQWNSIAEERTRERDAARTEAATLRAAIEREADAIAALAAQAEGLDFAPAQEARGIAYRLAERSLRAALAAHPAPEAAPPTLTVTQEQVRAAQDALYGSDLVREDEDVWDAVEAATDAVIHALGVTVEDAEADRG